MSADRFVATGAIRRAVAGRQADVLDALGIAWRSGSPHINCPYRGHADSNASWRWDEEKAKAFCTCTKSDSIFDVVMKVEGVDFEAAKIRVAELLKLDDLIKAKGAAKGGQSYQASDAESLLGAPADRRDDNLPIAYLAHRLGADPAAVPIPTTPMIGLKALG